MSLPEQIAAYLRPPFVISNAALAAALVEAGQQRLTHATGLTISQYSVTNCLHPAATEAPGPALGSGLPRLEYPVPRLAGFYQEHGLEPLATAELVATQAAEKLRRAWSLLESVSTTGASLRALVRTIQVLRSSDPEIDVSYSHPDIPFSVFVSVGEDTSLISSLRVAESLLHEAMHLKLTLLEQEVEMVRPGGQGVYYSPWRDEDRPVRGVLHGLFVFAAVQDFYSVFIRSAALNQAAVDYIKDRLATIADEFQAIVHFPSVPDLTSKGRQLAASLVGYPDALGKP